MQEFNKITGCPILLNTSLNLNGYPIAGTIKDSKSLFLNTNIDCLVVGNTFLEKDNKN
jgi:carbamoyltransferase